MEYVVDIDIDQPPRVVSVFVYNETRSCAKIYIFLKYIGIKEKNNINFLYHYNT
jgi:hypothetical protein